MKEKEIKNKVINEAGVETTIESLSSVELSRTAGGEIRPKVKVYNIDPFEAQKIAIEIMDNLNKKYKVIE